jgi:predicted kinase
MKPRLILMCGLPGSGKTTLARRLADEVPAIRLCTDDWQAALDVDLKEGDRDSEAFHDLLEAQLWAHAQELIRHGQTIIFEKGLWLRSERDEKRREARELGVDIELHYFDVPLDELARRLEKRNSESNRNGFSITREQIEEYFDTFEPPDDSELALFPISIVHRSEPWLKGCYLATERKTTGSLGSLLRPELRRIDCRVTDPVAMIASWINTLQGHQSLSVGSGQFLQYRGKRRADCRHSQPEPGKSILLVRVLNAMEPGLGDSFHFGLAVHLLRVVGNYDFKTGVLGLAVEMEILGTAPPRQVDYMLDLMRATQQRLDR